MEIRACAADIDYTLSEKNGALPHANVLALECMHAHGVKLGLATGRQISEKMRHYGKEFWHLSFEFDFLIAMNGGQVLDQNTGRGWNMDLLDQKKQLEILMPLMPFIDAHAIAVNAEGGANRNGMHFENYEERVFVHHGYHTMDCTGDPQRFTEKPCTKLLFRFEDDSIQAAFRRLFEEKLGAHWAVFSSFPGTLEVMEKGIDKGRGLAWYAEESGIPLRTIIAFGDNENDISLFEKAGFSVCLANGIPSARKSADAVTEYSCVEGGFGKYLMKHFLIPYGWMKEDV